MDFVTGVGRQSSRQEGGSHHCKWRSQLSVEVCYAFFIMAHLCPRLLCFGSCRFLGWVRSSKEAAGALDCSLFGTEAAQDWIEEFCRWCQSERGLSFSTIGSYLNSLISAVNYAHANRVCDVSDQLLQAMYNLRLQSESQGSEDRKW